jgi:hypothetical protein
VPESCAFVDVIAIWEVLEATAYERGSMHGATEA